ncbi:unnamed protein product [Cyclocybe aegerita]|uniref:Nucleolar protein 12 n=1 Tax=Cyclocybe aegerita TaxID=1973307 RepID=A0A8S0W435_CYCAE|nr:unnamed protein product [Cyclocybe aegerita]
MSLSSFLLGSKPPVDAELDGLFKAALPTAPDAPPIPGPSKGISKQKRKPEAEKIAPEKPHKRAKGSSEPTIPASKSKKDIPSPDKSKKQSVVEESAQKKSRKKEKEKEIKLPSDEEGSDDNSDLEIAYLNKEKRTKPTKESEQDVSDSSSDESEVDSNVPVHESQAKGARRRVKQPKKKTVLEDETPERRDQRTIFVGNLPIDVASKKPLKKQLQNHILSFVPTAKIESVRFRSIPFQAPTTTLPTSADEGNGTKSKPNTQAPKKEPRAHDKERATSWRNKRDEKDEENVKADEKKFLNPAQKKKIAFINQEFHASADSVNAYVVFAHPRSSEGRPANLPPLSPAMDPYEAAFQAASKCDGSLFMERMLRADLVGKNRGKAAPRKDDDGVEVPAGILEADPRLSVFVGNLDFASKEEDLRAFFESVVTAERGAPPEKDDGTMSETKKSSWVTRVRIVRDKDTLLGKGFAYVQLADRECVDELLALEESKLKFAKRKLRVQRCKTLPGSKTLVAGGSTTTGKSGKWAGTPTPIVVPQGNPALGEKLVGLPKEERKKLKSTDADRVARRLAKKKARMAMEKSMKGKEPGGKTRKRVRS